MNTRVPGTAFMDKLSTIRGRHMHVPSNGIAETFAEYALAVEFGKAVSQTDPHATVGRQHFASDNGTGCFLAYGGALTALEPGSAMVRDSGNIRMYLYDDNSLLFAVLPPDYTHVGCEAHLLPFTFMLNEPDLLPYGSEDICNTLFEDVLPFIEYAKTLGTLVSLPTFAKGEFYSPLTPHEENALLPKSPLWDGLIAEITAYNLSHNLSDKDALYIDVRGSYPDRMGYLLKPESWCFLGLEPAPDDVVSIIEPSFSVCVDEIMRSSHPLAFMHWIPHAYVGTLRGWRPCHAPEIGILETPKDQTPHDLMESFPIRDAFRAQYRTELQAARRALHIDEEAHLPFHDSLSPAACAD